MYKNFTEWVNPVHPKYIRMNLIVFIFSYVLVFSILFIPLTLSIGSANIVLLICLIAFLLSFLVEFPIHYKLKKAYSFRLNEDCIEMKQFALKPMNEYKLYFNKISKVSIVEPWPHKYFGFAAIRCDVPSGNFFASVNPMNDLSTTTRYVGGKFLFIPGMLKMEAVALKEELEKRIKFVKEHPQSEAEKILKQIV